MKTKDLQTMSDNELTLKLAELKTELFNLRFSHSTGNLANPMQLRNIKKDIARINTIVKARDIQNKKVNG